MRGLLEEYDFVHFEVAALGSEAVCPPRERPVLGLSGIYERGPEVAACR